MLNRFFRAFPLVFLLCLGAGSGFAQAFSPDGTQILFPRYDAQGVAVQVIASVNGANPIEIPDSSGALAAKWSPNGKYVVFGNAQREARLYTVKTGKTRLIARNVEPPFAWREDSASFAGIQVVSDKKTGLESRRLCRFDRDGYPMGAVPLGNVQLAPFAPLYWVPSTDELMFMTNEQGSVNAYLTDSKDFRKVSSSNDLIGMGRVGNTQHVIWARRGPNLRYILMTLYQFNAALSSVTRLNFPERIPAMNPDPHHAPDSLFNVRFSPDGSRLVVIARVTEGQKSLYHAYTMRVDGSEVYLLDKYATPPDFLYNWSPNGAQLTWMWKSKLMTGNYDGTGKTKVPTN